MGVPETTGQGEAIRRFIDSMPASETLGIEVVAIGKGQSVIEMPIRVEVTFDGQAVQGGVVGVLADYAAVAAAGSTLDEGWTVATLSCETHNLLPAIGERLVAKGEVIKGGSRHLVAKADVHLDSADGPLCLTGLFTAAALPAR